MLEAYESLTMGEQEDFTRLVNSLLSHTYLLAEQYSLEGVLGTNHDYLFVETHFELFQEYLALAGFTLERHSDFGVIRLGSSYDANRIHLDKLTTILVYAMRLLYEEKREEISLVREVITTTGDVVAKLLHLGAIKKKPSNALLSDSLRTLSRFRIILKKEGAWEDSDTKLMILPTILFVVEADQLSGMVKLLDVPVDEEEEEET